MTKTRHPLTGLARGMRANGTDAERRLWHRLRNRGLAGLKFRRQVPVGPYIADFACIEHRLVVELDGGQHVERAGSDATRSQELARLGYRVIRFWNDEVLRDPAAVCEVIMVAAGCPSPQPSPR